MIAFNRTKGRELVSRVEKAQGHASRARGLLGRAGLAPQEGLWIAPCAMIHTFFMRFAIDAVFLDRQLKVVRVLEGLKPWRFSPWVGGAGSVLELAAGASRGLVAAGDQLEIH